MTRKTTRLPTAPKRYGILIAAMALALTACGGDDEEPPPGNAADETQDVEDEEAAEPDAADETQDVQDEEAAEPDAEVDFATHFEGETFEMWTGYSVGGGYDTYLRAVAPYLEEHGNVTTVVDVVEGAGGLIAVNTLYGQSGDPTQFMLVNGPGNTSAWLAGTEGTNFEMDELTILGRLVSEPHVLMVAGDSEIEDFQELLDRGEFSWATAGPGSTAVMNATVMADALDLDIDQVFGFDGLGDMQGALLRGELEVMSLEPSSALGAIEAGDLKPLVIIGDSPSELIPDVPVLTDYDLGEEGEELLSIHFNLIDLGRMLAAPPGLSDEDADALRQLFEAAATDPQFLEEMEAADRPVNYASGEEVQEMLRTVAEAPARYIELINKAYEG